MAVVAQNYATYPDQNMAPAYRNDPAPGYDPNNPSLGKPNDVPGNAFGTAGGILAQPKIGDRLGPTEQTDDKNYEGDVAGKGQATVGGAKVTQASSNVSTFKNYLQPSISPSGMVSYGI